VEAEDESEFVVSFDVGSGGRADGGEGAGAGGVNGGLPEDVVSVWGKDRLARQLVAAWGLEAFRGSWLHQMAVSESRRGPKPRFRPDRKGGSK
jgi:hypothetical protein